MKRKGFTLIELLAVIVILAIVALIATPTILGVIDGARKGAAESSVYGFVNAIEQAGLLNIIDDENYKMRPDGTYDLNTIGQFDYKGKGPNNLCVTIKDGTVESGTFQFDKYIVDYVDRKAKVNSDEIKIDCSVSMTTVTFSPNESNGKIDEVKVIVQNEGNGIDQESLKYVWTTTTSEPSEDAFINSFQNGNAIIMPEENVNVYYLWISVIDGKGSKIIKRSGIYKIDITSPIITILGENPVLVKQGMTYVDAGATAMDNVDGNITSKIITTSNINIDFAGTYTVKYDVTDSIGNKTSANRTVVVQETIPPTISFTPNGNSDYATSANVKVTVSDNVAVDNDSLKYLWTSNLEIPSADDFKFSFENNDVISNDKEGVNYLWVLAKDIYGNTTIAHSNEYLLGKTIKDMLGTIAPVGTTVTASGSYPVNDPAGKAFDGDITNFWNAGGYSGWVTATFPTPQYISAIQIMTGANPASNVTFTVSYMKDNNWLDIGTATFPIAHGNTGPTITTPLKITPGQYNSLKITASSSTTWVGLTEVTFLH